MATVCQPEGSIQGWEEAGGSAGRVGPGAGVRALGGTHQILEASGKVTQPLVSIS